MARPPADPTAAPAPPRLPPARSGTLVLVVLAAIALLFLAGLWYGSFQALNARGPDRAFLTQTSWDNGTIVLAVTELDVRGSVLGSGLTVNITSQAHEPLFSGRPGTSSNVSNFTLTVAYLDKDNSTTLTLGDEFTITAVPAAGLDDLILSTFYLYADGREWARLPLPSSGK